MKISLIGLFLLLSVCAVAQTGVKVTGQVTTEARAPVAMALVTVSRADNSIITYKYAGEDGRYRLEFVRDTGNYIISVKALGFNAASLSIENNKQSQYEKNFILKNNTIALNEVIIKSKATGVSVHEDTTTYKAKAFTDGTEKSVEDLLKKLPGVSVDDNGGISFKGKKVDKVFLDGDDLLGKNYKLATKNINATFIDEVQAMENFSEDDLLKGIEKSDKTVLNLKIDKKKQQLLFGSADANWGTKNFRDLGLNLFSYQRKAKVYLIGEHNTIGRRSSAGDNQLDNIEISGNDEPSVASSPLIAANNLLSSRFSEERINFNKETLAALMATIRPASKLKIETNLSVYNDRAHTDLLNETTYKLADRDIFFSENDQFRRQPLTANIKVKLDYKPGANSRLAYVFEARRSRDNSNRALVFQNDSTVEHLSQKLSDCYAFAHHQLNYAKRLNPKNALTINVNFFQNEYPQTLTVTTDGDRFSTLFQTPAEAVRQKALNKLSEFNATIKLLGSRGKFNYNVSTGTMQINESLASSAILSTDTSTLAASSSFRNNNSLTNQTFFIKAGTAYTLKKLKLVFNLNLFHTAIRFAGTNVESNKGFNLANPAFSLIYKLNNESKLNASYSLNSQFSAIAELKENYILEDYRTISRGLPQVINQKNQTFKLGYNYDDFYAQFNLSANLFLIRKTDSYSYDYVITETFTSLSRLIIPESNIYLGVMQADKFIPWLSSSVRLNVNYSVNNYFSKLNGGELRNNVFKNGIYKLTFTSAFDGATNFAVGGALNANNLRIKTGDLNTTFTNNFYTCFANIKLKKDKWFVSVNNDVSVISKRAFYFLDAQATYSIVKDKLNISLTGKNVGNNDNIRQVFIDDYQVNSISYRLLPRYFLFGVNYKF
ncbi:TonB-dependent receptor [Mucilaginibacter sp.]|uniref:TonB-dependent receptor n=1 Tax=Mucilaginibacter sp. TaxID=1882438 RepID=UPI0032631D76